MAGKSNNVLLDSHDKAIALLTAASLAEPVPAWKLPASALRFWSTPPGTIDQVLKTIHYPKIEGTHAKRVDWIY